MSGLDFVIPGPILPWQRARRSGRRYFNSPEQVAYQRMVAVLCQVAMRKQNIKPFMHGAVSVSVFVSYPGPKKLWGQWKATRPDADNIFKNIADSLNGIAYKDDGQIAWKTVKKWWGIDESAIVEIRGLSDDADD